MGEASSTFFILLHIDAAVCVNEQVEANTEAFNRAPDSFLERLAELLSMPQQGCDVLAPSTGVMTPDWLEYNCRVLPPSIAGYDPEVIHSSQIRSSH